MSQPQKILSISEMQYSSYQHNDTLIISLSLLFFPHGLTFTKKSSEKVGLRKYVLCALSNDACTFSMRWWVVLICSHTAAQFNFKFGPIPERFVQSFTKKCAVKVSAKFYNENFLVLYEPNLQMIGAM